MNNKYFIKNNPVVRKIFLAMLAPTILMNLTTALASFADAVITSFDYQVFGALKGTEV